LSTHVTLIHGNPQAELGNIGEDFLGNLTEHPEYKCLTEGFLLGPPPEAKGGPFCDQAWDSLLCWPPTTAGQLASQPCFDELNGIKYDTSRE
jgi:hypothetical protein